MPDQPLAELTLRVEDFAGPDRWRWGSGAPDGEVVTRHEARRWCLLAVTLVATGTVAFLTVTGGAGKP